MSCNVLWMLHIIALWLLIYVEKPSLPDQLKQNHLQQSCHQQFAEGFNAFNSGDLVRTIWQPHDIY